ncbi:glycosyltransferase family 4 protein [Virgibacillus sp. 6R]|uniref:glycosyltransferase family 4 protein n=1 Tax=Virgibacillus sp. 6R TaxID=1911587 RepID=UPI00090C86C8|nr:hypothetical protein BKP57_07855 [Virgibacillus sp. 6R]
MKVLHLNAGSETGGGMYHILGLMKEFKDKQFILGVMEQGELLQRAKQLGIKTVHFSSSSKLSIPLIKKMISFIKQEKITCIHSHGPRANVYTSILKKMLPFQWVVTIHSDPFLDFMEKGTYGKLLSRINMNAVKNANKLIAISQPFKDCLIDAGIDENKIITTLNGIDFKQRVKNIYKKRDFGINADEFIFLMVARLEKVKGHQFAIKAFSEILKRNSKCHLMLAGDGRLYNQLKKMVFELGIEKNVHFLGYRKDVQHLYKIADVTLLTSLSESFPLVLLESAKAKTPVISSDVGEVNKLIVNNGVGWIVKPANTMEIIAAMKDALFFHKQGKLSLIGEKLYQHASKKFTLEIFAENIYNVYRGLN